MARLSRPLNRTALWIADDIFYANHPELVQNGKRKLAADLPSYAVMIKGKLRDILNSLRGKLKSLANILPGPLGKQAEEAVNSTDEVAKIDEAVKELQDGLNKSLDGGVDFERKGTTKTKNTRKQTDVEPPEFPNTSPSITRPTKLDESSSLQRVPHRTPPRMEDGTLKWGWKHIDTRHISGNHPGGAGDLFPSDTTRAELESVADNIVRKGT